MRTNRLALTAAFAAMGLLLLSGILWALQNRGPDPSLDDALPQNRPIYLLASTPVDGDLFATLTLYLSPPVEFPGTNRPLRLLSATVNWRVGLDLVGAWHVHLEVEPGSREPLTSRGTVTAEAANPAPERLPVAGIYQVFVEPRPGLAWGAVRTESDLQFRTQLLEPDPPKAR